MNDELNLKDIISFLSNWKKIIIAFVFVVTFSSIVVSLMLPKTYKASALLLPIGGSQPGSVAMMLTAELVGGGSGGSRGGQLLPILKSHFLIEKFIERYKLLPILYPDLWDAEKQEWRQNALIDMESAVSKLLSIINISEDKIAQTIKIEAVTRNPQLSADIVNDFIFVFRDNLRSNTYTEAKRYRLFIEKQLQKINEEYLLCGKELSGFYAKQKISNVTPVVNVDISMDSYGDENDSGKDDYVAMPAQKDDPFSDLNHLIQKSEALEESLANMKAIGAAPKVVEDVPQQVYFQYLLGKQKLLEQQLYVLNQRYQFAKIDEAKDDLDFKVIDWGHPPTKRYQPQRVKIVLLTFFGSIALVFFVAVISQSVKKNLFE